LDLVIWYIIPSWSHLKKFIKI